MFFVLLCKLRLLIPHSDIVAVLNMSSKPKKIIWIKTQMGVSELMLYLYK
jgi:hypothetical protein